MPRSSRKGFYRASAVDRKLRQADEQNSQAPIKIMSRASTILPVDIGRTFGVHNGKAFIPLRVSPEHVGRKFGEYSSTKIFRAHGGDKKTVLKGGKAAKPAKATKTAKTKK